MKTVFDKDTREELITRVSLLDKNSRPQWGKMNVYQMLKHCTKWNEMILGEIQVKQMILGKLFGKMALKNVLKNEMPLRKNSPTASELIIKEKAGDIALQKLELTKRICEYEHFNQPSIIHPFFGTMTKEQAGQFVYKHHDHHLKQFGI